VFKIGHIQSEVNLILDAVSYLALDGR
jgi:hypothetical protein